MATKKKERIKFTALEVENFERVTLAHLVFSGEPGVIEVTGKNRAGKTSLRDAGVALLGGRGVIKDDPRNDEAQGPTRVLGTFSNGFRILLRPTASNPKGNLVIEGPDRVKENQTFLNAWVGEGSFDLGGLKEYQTKPEKLVPILLSVAKDKTLPGQLTEIRSERASLEGQRSPWISGKQRAERTKRPEGDRPEPVDVTSEAARLTELQEIREGRIELGNQWDGAQGTVLAAKTRIEMGQGIIRNLKAELAAAREDLTVLKGQLVTDEKAEEQCRLACDAVDDPAPEIEEVRARLQEADATNEALEPWKEWERAQAEIEEARERIEGFGQDLDHLRKAERKLLKEKGPDLPGLSFDDEGLPLLWKRVLAKASGREWLEFSAALAFAHDPELGVAFFDEAEGVDEDGMRDLHALAQTHDFQLFLYKINPNGVGEVVICEDGRAWNVVEPETT